MPIHMTEDVLENVSHRQSVFTIPKGLRLYFRYNRELLGNLIHAAWEPVNEIYSEEIVMREEFPGKWDTLNAVPHLYAELISD